MYKEHNSLIFICRKWLLEHLVWTYFIYLLTMVNAGVQMWCLNEILKYQRDPEGDPKVCCLYFFHCPRRVWASCQLWRLQAFSFKLWNQECFIVIILHVEMCTYTRNKKKRTSIYVYVYVNANYLHFYYSSDLLLGRKVKNVDGKKKSTYPAGHMTLPLLHQM